MATPMGAAVPHRSLFHGLHAVWLGLRAALAVCWLLLRLTGRAVRRVVLWGNRWLFWLGIVLFPVEIVSWLLFGSQIKAETLAVWQQFAWVGGGPMALLIIGALLDPLATVLKWR